MNPISLASSNADVSTTPSAAFCGAATVTIVRDQIRTLTKRVSRRPDGSLSLESGARVAEGEFRTVLARTPEDLAHTIMRGLTYHDALIHGVAVNGDVSGPLATKNAIASGSAPVGARAKTKDTFMFPHERPGVLMLDLDIKDAPPHISPASLVDARERLISALPALAHAPMLAIPSASANIYAVGTDECLRDLTGIRIYVWVSRAEDIPTIGRRVHQRLVLDRGGFAKVSTHGSIQVASIVDTTVWTPERLDFAAGAQCGEGLEQRREPIAWNNDAIPIALSNIPELTAPEMELLVALESGIRDAARIDADRKRTVWRGNRGATGRATAVTWSASGEVQYVDGEHDVRLADPKAGWVSVNEILRNPEGYEGALCFDPMEPDYDGGRVVGKIYAKNGIIHSMAHGGVDYALRRSGEEEFDVDSGASAASDVDALPTAAAGLSRFNERFGFVRSLGAILYTPRAGSYEIMPMERWRDYTRNEVVQFGKNILPLSRVWMESPHRRTLSRLVFEPDLAPHSVLPAPDGDEPVFNTWPGFATKPSADGSCTLFLRHLQEVIAGGDERVFQWVIMWLAAIVQRPSAIPETALVLRGAQGAGKDTVGHVMRHIIGDRLHTTIADPEHLTGRFNAQHEGKIILQVEEGFFAGNKRDRSKLKHLVTATTTTIERKNVDAYEVRNCAHILITSNEEWVVPAELGNRRFMVLNVDGRYAHDLEYHGALREEMFERNGCARLLHYLLYEVEVDWSAIRRPMATDAIRDQQLESLDEQRLWLLDILTDGALRGDTHGDGVVPKEDLYSSYRAACREERRASKTKLTKFLKQYGVGECRPTILGRRTHAYLFPPLLECRERFGREFACPPEWDEQRTWASDPLFESEIETPQKAA